MMVSNPNSNYQMPWTKKYSPKSRSEIQGQDAVLETLDKFIQKFKSQSKKGLILYGKSGTGKTSCIYACAGDFDLEVLEINASDFRNKAKIESIIGGAALQQSLFSKGKIILMDEIDGLSGNSDRGGISALASLIEKSKFPIIMTANNPYDKKFKALRKVCDLAELSVPSHLAVTEVLNRIVKEETIKTQESVIKSLARRCGGDIRAAINDLQSACSGNTTDMNANKTLSKEDIDNLSEREHKEELNDALMRIMKTTDPFVAKQAISACEESWDTFMLWLDENLPKEYTNSADLARSYEALSRADVFNGRIRRMQHYRFLVYITDLLSAGVAVAKDEKYKGLIKFDKPKKLLTMYISKMRYAKRNSIAEKISAVTYSSKKACIKNTIPYLHKIARNPEMASQLRQDYDLSKEEIDWLKTH